MAREGSDADQRLAEMHTRENERFEILAVNYDKDMVINEFHGPQILAKYFERHARKLGLTKDIKILDVAAGSGLAAQQLKDLGYHYMDAVDGCHGMLDKAKNKELYVDYHCCNVGGSGSLPMMDDTYDATVMCGAMYPRTSIPQEVFSEIIRVMKPGGLIVHIMRYELTLPGGVHENLNCFMDDLEAKGQWTKLERAVCGDYYMGKHGLIHVYKMGGGT